MGEGLQKSWAAACPGPPRQRQSRIGMRGVGVIEKKAADEGAEDRVYTG